MAGEVGVLKRNRGRLRIIMVGTTRTQKTLARRQCSGLMILVTGHSVRPGGEADRGEKRGTNWAYSARLRLVRSQCPDPPACRTHSLTLAMLFQHRQKCTVVVLAVGVNNTVDGHMVIIGNGSSKEGEG